MNSETGQAPVQVPHCKHFLILCPSGNESTWSQNAARSSELDGELVLSASIIGPHLYSLLKHDCRLPDRIRRSDGLVVRVRQIIEKIIYD